MIHISLSPNLEKDDLKAAIVRIISFWKFKNTTYQKALKANFSKYFTNNDVYFFNSGRSALLVFLKSLNLSKKDEVILQSFTCNAVSNSIKWAGATPIYCDIDKIFNIDIEDLEKNITKNTKVIIIQNTFGIPAQIDKITQIAQKNNLLVIEDCAHALGATYRGRKLGTFGDIAFFSFGRDKIISSVYGGALLINNKILKNNLEIAYNNLRYPSIFWTVQQLLHVPLTWFILKTYNFGGKYLLYLLQRLKILSYSVSKKERKGKMPNYFPKKLPEALTYLAYVQFKKLNRLNEHRKKISKIYEKGLENKKDIYLVKNYDSGSVFLRYPILYKDAFFILNKAKKTNIILGDWYKEVIAPCGIEEKSTNYKKGSCKFSESMASHIINLPTNIRTSEEDAKKNLSLFNN